MAIKKTSNASSRIAKNIRNIRRLRNFSQEHLSKITGVPKSTLNHLESGQSSPSIDLVEKLSMALGVSIEELVSETSGKVQVLQANQMTVVKTIPQCGRLTKILPDPMTGVDPYYLELTGKLPFPGTLQAPKGRKLIYCVSGKIKITTDGNDYEVQTGGSCLFAGDSPHSIVNIGSETARIIKIHIYG